MTVLSTWNDFAWPLIALKENSLFTLLIGLLYLCQRYVVQGFTRSSIG